MSKPRLRSNTLDSRDAALDTQLQNHGVHRFRSESLSRKSPSSTPPPKIVTVPPDALRSHQLDWSSSFSSDSLDEGSVSSHRSLRTTRKMPSRPSPTISEDTTSNIHDVEPPPSGHSPSARSGTAARYGRRSPSPLRSLNAKAPLDNSLLPPNTPSYSATQSTLAPRLSLSPSMQNSQASAPSSPVYVHRGQRSAASDSTAAQELTRSILLQRIKNAGVDAMGEGEATLETESSSESELDRSVAPPSPPPAAPTPSRRPRLNSISRDALMPKSPVPSASGSPRIYPLKSSMRTRSSNPSAPERLGNETVHGRDPVNPDAPAPKSPNIPLEPHSTGSRTRTSTPIAITAVGTLPDRTVTTGATPERAPRARSRSAPGVSPKVRGAAPDAAFGTMSPSPRSAAARDSPPPVPPMPPSTPLAGQRKVASARRPPHGDGLAMEYNGATNVKRGTERPVVDQASGGDAKSERSSPKFKSRRDALVQPKITNEVNQPHDSMTDTEVVATMVSTPKSPSASLRSNIKAGQAFERYPPQASSARPARGHSSVNFDVEDQDDLEEAKTFDSHSVHQDTERYATDWGQDRLVVVSLPSEKGRAALRDIPTSRLPPPTTTSVMKKKHRTASIGLGLMFGALPEPLDPLVVSSYPEISSLAEGTEQSRSARAVTPTRTPVTPTPTARFHPNDWSTPVHPQDSRRRERSRAQGPSYHFVEPDTPSFDDTTATTDNLTRFEDGASMSTSTSLTSSESASTGFSTLDKSELGSVEINTAVDKLIKRLSALPRTTTPGKTQTPQDKQERRESNCRYRVDTSPSIPSSRSFSARKSTSVSIRDSLQDFRPQSQTTPTPKSRKQSKGSLRGTSPTPAAETEPTGANVNPLFLSIADALSQPCVELSPGLSSPAGFDFGYQGRDHDRDGLVNEEAEATVWAQLGDEGEQVQDAVDEEVEYDNVALGQRANMHRRIDSLDINLAGNHPSTQRHPSMEVRAGAEYLTPGAMSSMDSALSIAELEHVDRWYDPDNEEMSSAAEELFKKLGSESSRESLALERLEGDHQDNVCEETVDHAAPSPSSSDPRIPHTVKPAIEITHAPTFLAHDTPSSPYSADVGALEAPASGSLPLPATWRSMLDPGAYESLQSLHGTFEMRRQEVIRELCTTELYFIRSLRIVIRLFVQPLRASNGTQWIPGLPKNVARLFDWLDDIVHLHTQIYLAIRGCQTKESPVVLRIAELLRPFVPRLELYQPYLARLEDVTQSIEMMIRDPESDFGEFIRLQSASPECGSMGLSSFLLKPVQRLMKYPLFFKQLWELTSRSHPDHLATFSLLHSTDLVIRVMQEVKAREDEYDIVKTLVARIKGLPEGFQVASRDRRLIAQGLLRLVNVTEKDRTQLNEKHEHAERLSFALPPSPLGNVSRLFPVVAHHRSPLTPQFPRHPAMSATSPSVKSMGPRPESMVSEYSTTPSEYATQNRMSAYPGEPARGPTAPHVGDGKLDRRRSRSASLKESVRSKLRDTNTYVFVFSDFVILTTPVAERNSLLRSPKVSERKESWKLLDDIGVSRILNFNDYSGKISYDHLLAIDLLPLPEVHGDTPSAGLVFLSLPEKLTSRMAIAPPDILAEARRKWKLAFEECLISTLRSLTYPSGNNDYLSINPTPSHLQNTTQKSLSSLLAAGLPLPKSPSQQFEAERNDYNPADGVIEEREERGWWALRFQQVLREMQGHRL